MGKDMYFGIGGAAHRVKGLYVGMGGRAQKVTKAYVGVNGKARLFWCGGKVAEGDYVLYSNDFGVYTTKDGANLIHLGTLVSGTGRYDFDKLISYNLTGMARKDDLLVHMMLLGSNETTYFPIAVADLAEMTLQAKPVSVGSSGVTKTNLDIRRAGDKIVYYYGINGTTSYPINFRVIYTSDGKTWTVGYTGITAVSGNTAVYTPAYITQLADGTYIVMPSYGTPTSMWSSARYYLTSADGINWSLHQMADTASYPAGVIRYVNGRYWTAYGKSGTWSYSTPGGTSTGSTVAFAYANDIWGPWTEIYDASNTVRLATSSFNGDVINIGGYPTVILGNEVNYKRETDGTYMFRLSAGGISKTKISSEDTNARNGNYNGKDRFVWVDSYTHTKLYCAKLNGTSLEVTVSVMDKAIEKCFLVS